MPRQDKASSTMSPTYRATPVCRRSSISANPWTFDGLLCEARERVLHALVLDKVGWGRLVYMQHVEYRVLEREQRDECGISITREGSHKQASERVKQVVVGGRDDGEQDQSRVKKEEGT